MREPAQAAVMLLELECSVPPLGSMTLDKTLSHSVLSFSFFYGGRAAVLGETLDVKCSEQLLAHCKYSVNTGGTHYR